MPSGKAVEIDGVKGTLHALQVGNGTRYQFKPNSGGAKFIKSDLGVHLMAGSHSHPTPKTKGRRRATRKESPVAESRIKGLPQTLKFEMPYKVDASPELSAAWDVCVGLVDGLQRDGQKPNPVAVAKQMEAAARGESSDADNAEQELGRNIAKLFPYVLLAMGIGKAQWSDLRPELLDDATFDGSADDAPKKGPSLVEVATNTAIDVVTGAAGQLIDLDLDGDGDSEGIGQVLQNAIGGSDLLRDGLDFEDVENVLQIIDIAS